MVWAQVARPDSPIRAEEFLPALLAEDPLTIRVAMTWLGPDVVAEARRQAIDLINELRSRADGVVPDLDAKLEALGLPRAAGGTD